ncbi:DUF4435 domain-containing protein [Burkholderia sp. LMU1-1-1.1]|uniref:DUF4435 domain-containing protein n=1 Tax=Burkholderia sp. LMU1-1-1.1 TaxID=3135266 RepID=UPI00344A8C12
MMSDVYLHNMIQAKESRAVLKMSLAKLRASVKDKLILAFEGREDKWIYSQWINRIDPGFKYEPFPCGGKKKVLELKRAVDADRNNLSKGILFAVDRDFDELQGNARCERIFMTDAYSVENYLVETEVLQELLKNDLECHAQPELRQALETEFNRLYMEFLTCMRDVNMRIFMARKLDIQVVGGISKKMSDFITVTLDSVSLTGLRCAEFIPLEREPKEEEIDKLQGEFDGLDAKLRHRGKFAMAFMMKWIELLAADRKSEQSKWFAHLGKNIRVNTQAITCGMMATKSPLPPGLPEFIRKVA